MSLQAGTSFGPYDILAPLGAGGMGEVYRARDTRLNRDVAIKTLPESLANDPERLARFRREAETLAALNHPNIATIYGLEQIDGVLALAMELVEGPTLADRLGHVASGFGRTSSEPPAAEGPPKSGRHVATGLPLDEVLPLARQLALALEAAHERGIIHRDLKPANIKLAADGSLKLLDFGLAKALDPVAGGAGRAGEAGGAGGFTASPTISVMATQAGVLLGTAAYMSPEQVRGIAVDKRADIWAFGVVLYEMLTGGKMFGGDTISDTLAGVLREPIDLNQLPSDTPPAMRRLLARCLERDPKRRLRDIGEARIAIDDHVASPQPEVAAAPTADVRSSWQLAIPWALVALLAIGLAAIGRRVWESPPARNEEAATFNLDLGKLSLQRGSVVGGMLAISPDGRRVVITAQADADGNSRPRLYQRTLDRLEFTPIAGTEDSSIPFISPDGDWVGFESRGQLKKVAFAGGVPIRICDVTSTPGGATWLNDDTIVFALGGQLLQVPADGGTAQPLTTTQSGDIGYSWPASIPGRRAVLYTARSGRRGTGGAGGHFAVGVLDLKTRQEHIVADSASYPVFARGFVVYAQQVSDDRADAFSGGLLALPFDAARLTATGAAVSVLDDVRVFGGGAGHYGLASNGTLAFVPGIVSNTIQLVWLTPSPQTAAGSTVPLGETLGAVSARLSRDDQMALMQVGGAGSAAVYALNLNRGSRTRVTFDGDAVRPIFGPGENMVTFSSQVQPGLWYASIDGSKPPTRLNSFTGQQSPESWTRDGSALVLTQSKNNIGDIMVLHRGEQEPKALVATSADERNPTLSPDDHWLAYQSNDSGRVEVYVRPFPGPGGRYTVSTGGGETPQWSKDGRRLFYYRRPPGSLMAVDVAAGGSFSAGAPRPIVVNADLVSGQRSPAGRRAYDIARDGRFLVPQIPPDARGSDAVHLILHFDDKIRRQGASPRR